jgi:hypothetical protein
MPKNGQHKIVADKALGSRKETEVPHDHESLVVGQFTGSPGFDVLVHGNLSWHPVVGTAVEVMLPGPAILKRHKLVDIDLPTVDQSLIAGIDTATGNR